MQPTYIGHKKYKKSTQNVLLKSTHSIYYFQNYHQLIKCPIPLIPLLSKGCDRDRGQILLLILSAFQ